VDQPGELKLRGNRVRQRHNRWPPSVDRELRRFTVQRVALRVQLPQLGKRILNLQQRPLGIVPQSTEQFFWRGAQVDDGPVISHQVSILFAKNGTAARRKNNIPLHHQLGKRDLFDITKSMLALALKKCTDTASDALLNFGIKIYAPKT